MIRKTFVWGAVLAVGAVFWLTQLGSVSAQGPRGGGARDAAREGFGPPPEIVAAWQNGEMPVAPDWVLEMRASLGLDPFGPPPWVMNRSAGIRGGRGGFGGSGFGPPAWVLDAWANGEGFDLPGAGRRGGPPAEVR